MNKARMIIILVAGCWLTACGKSLMAPEFVTPANAPSVEMTLDSKTHRFYMTTSPTKHCVDAGKEVKGCFGADRNTVVQVPFNLDRATAAKWQLQRFEICMGGDASSRDCQLEWHERAEFSASLDAAGETEFPDSKGIINLAALGMNIERFSLNNLNLYDREWYYRVQICPKGTAKKPRKDQKDEDIYASCIWNTDPPIINKGRVIF